MNFVNTIKKNCSSLKTLEIVLFVLLALYLVSNVSTPYELAPHVNNVYMYLSLIAITVLLFLYSNPLLAIFFGISAIVLLHRSKQVDHNVMQPSVQNKDKVLQNLNANLKNKTLEEEIVGQIVRQPMNIAGPSNYHPVMCESHNATQV